MRSVLFSSLQKIDMYNVYRVKKNTFFHFLWISIVGNQIYLANKYKYVLSYLEKYFENKINI